MPAKIGQSRDYVLDFVSEISGGFDLNVFKLYCAFFLNYKFVNIFNKMLYIVPLNILNGWRSVHIVVSLTEIKYLTDIISSKHFETHVIQKFKTCQRQQYVYR